MKEDNVTAINFQQLKREIQLKAKNGIDFILAATLVWAGIFIIWRFTPYNSYNQSVLTFIFGSVMLPLALGFSKLFNTTWKIKNNPLQPLGLWLNFAQVIYFPFLVFILIRYPDYFIMAYAIITGAHLFPYAWFYDEPGYSVAAVAISVSSLLIALNIEPAQIFYIPLFTAVAFFLLFAWILVRYQRLKRVAGE